MELGAFNFDAPKAKRYISYDLYYDQTQNLSLEGDVHDLDNFISKNKFVFIAPHADRDLAWDYRPVGYLVRKARYPMVSEVGKTATLSLIKDVEEKNFCRFLPLSLWFILVLTHSGQVLLKNVTIVNPSYEACQNNLNDLYNVVKGFIGKDPQENVSHLLKMMEANIFSSLYSIHTSLVTRTNKNVTIVNPSYETCQNNLNDLYNVVKGFVGKILQRMSVIYSK